MPWKRITLIGALAALATLTAACTDDATPEASTPSSEAMEDPSASSMTIAEIAGSTEDFSTLAAAVEAVGLGETLSGSGPYTVFAPTDEAFAALPEGTLDELLKPANQDQLAAILTYHVVAGEVMSGDLSSGEVATVNGADATVSVEGGVVTITDGQGDVARVVTADIPASNGVIHVIDTVLLPPSG
ncbi:MAG TPA: fasciclin domain-containing protein [Actinomycetota bacterium]|nr:fasciclin domain-containing protein [Actinomycetota bacterium]